MYTLPIIMNIKPFYAPRAFTLIELLVSMGIFVVVITIALNAFLVSLRAQRAASAMITVQDNLSLVLEQMAREIRTGQIFCANSSLGGASEIPDVATSALCGSLGSDEIAFYNGYGRRVYYRLNATSLERKEEDGVYRALTAPNVKIDRFGIFVMDNDEDDTPPRITFTIQAESGEPGIDELDIFTNVQTTISPRCGQSGDATPVPQCPGDI